MINMKRTAIISALIYTSCIPIANYAILHWGTQPFPGGPHTIPVGFGLAAPSGVLFVGVALTARDKVQMLTGKATVLALIAVGVLLSYATSTPAVASASAVAFALSELADYAVFTPLADRGRLLLAVLLSGFVGIAIDTFVFLQMAFGSTQFWQGNALGKTWAAILATPFVLVGRRVLSSNAA